MSVHIETSRNKALTCEGNMQGEEKDQGKSQVVQVVYLSSHRFGSFRPKFYWSSVVFLDCDSQCLGVAEAKAMLCSGSPV
jgi:hypothetical protein